MITCTSYSVKQPIPTLMLSNAARSATRAWAKWLSDQVARDGITVNALAPGQIETERVRPFSADAARREEHAAAFLASEKPGYITGVTLLIDGGLFRGTY